MNKQVLSSIVAILILLVHVGMAFYLWVGFRQPVGGAAAQIVSVPTVVYVVGIIKWFVDTQGHITSKATVGISYVVAFSIIFIALFGGIVAAPILYSWQVIAGAEDLNNYFAFIEASFGAAFAFLYRDLFGDLPSDASV